LLDICRAKTTVTIVHYHPPQELTIFKNRHFTTALGQLSVSLSLR